jgi:hypothetical protein
MSINFKFDILILTFIVFTVLKFSGVVACSWWIVCIPLLIKVFGVVCGIIAAKMG